MRDVDYFQMTAEQIVNREHEEWRQNLRRDDLLRRINEQLAAIEEETR